MIYSKPNLPPPTNPSHPSATTPGQIIIQVKSGKSGIKDMRDLRGVLEREKAAMGVLICLQPPTRGRVAEAVSAGFYEHKTIRFIGLHPLMCGGDCQGQGYLKQRLSRGRTNRLGGNCDPQASYKPCTSQELGRCLSILFVFRSYSLRILFVFSGGALCGATEVPPRPWLVVTVLVGRPFKLNSTLLYLSAPVHCGGSPVGV